MYTWHNIVRPSASPNRTERMFLKKSQPAAVYYEEWCRWTRANQRRCTPRHRSGLAHTPAGAHFSGSCSQCRETRQHACCCAVLTTAMEHACHDATHRFGTSMHGRWSPRRPIARPPPNQPRRPHLPTHPHLLTSRLTGSPVWGASLKVLRNVLPSLQSPSLEQWGMSCPRPLNSSLGHHVWIHSKASINNSTQRAFTESYWYEAPALDIVFVYNPSPYFTLYINVRNAHTHSNIHTATHLSWISGFHLCTSIPLFYTIYKLTQRTHTRKHSHYNTLILDQCLHLL